VVANIVAVGEMHQGIGAHGNNVGHKLIVPLIHDGRGAVLRIGLCYCREQSSHHISQRIAVVVVETQPQLPGTGCTGQADSSEQ